MGWAYAVRRVLQLVPALFGVLLVTFVVVHLVPGDPAAAFAGEYASAETLADINRQYGLDKPMWAQFTTYVGNLLGGDLGTSFNYGRPVSTVIGERLPATLLLASTAMVLSIVFGLAIGKVAARRPNGPLDSSLTSLSLLGSAVPAFVIGQVAILWLGLHWGFFPTGGMHNIRAQYSGIDNWFDVAHHLALPALVLALSEMTLIIRLTRTGVIEQMEEDYVRTARAKGLREADVIGHHALPNAALPLITVIGSRVGFMLSGAVVIETVFSWPGVGGLLVAAVNGGDRPMALGLVFMVAASVLVVNLVTDLVYAWVDPRVRYR